MTFLPRRPFIQALLASALATSSLALAASLARAEEPGNGKATSRQIAVEDKAGSDQKSSDSKIMVLPPPAGAKPAKDATGDDTMSPNAAAVKAAREAIEAERANKAKDGAADTSGDEQAGGERAKNEKGAKPDESEKTANETAKPAAADKDDDEARETAAPPPRKATRKRATPRRRATHRRYYGDEDIVEYDDAPVYRHHRRRYIPAAPYDDGYEPPYYR